MLKFSVSALHSIGAIIRKKAWGPLAGFAFAVVFFVALNAAMVPISRSEYCGGTCHEMNGAYLSWELSSHGSNARGIRVECIDCHLPSKDKYFTHVAAKGYAGLKDAYKHFVAVDAGFNLFVRPAMYDAYHEVVVPNKVNEPASVLSTVVGPICESGDIIAKDRMLPEVKRGDYVAILDTGAYGFSMSSQYNGRPRCAEVLVKDGAAELIREKESIVDIIRHQVIPERLR